MRLDSLSTLWIVAGLGNPGVKYAATRHNAGFMVIDRISEEKRIPLAVRDGFSMGQGSIGDFGVVLQLHFLQDADAVGADILAAAAIS